MSDVALRPTFPPEELERLRQERLVTLLQSRDDPGTIASLAFSRVLFGAAHRFGTMTIGTAESIKGFTAEDLRNRYREVFRPDTSTLIVVGDIRPDQVLEQLESAFGGWKGDRPASPPVTLEAPPQPPRREVYLIDKSDAPQSEIRIGWIGVPRSTPDYFPILVMNTVLGGSFTSRLNSNLREEHGYTYGASSSFDMRVAPGPFVAGAAVQSDKTAEALSEFFNELNAILKTVPEDELRRAKNYVALRFPSGFETTGDVSRRLEEMLVYGLPETYFSDYVGNIQAVTAADVLRIAQKYIVPGRFLVVVVGDRKAVEPRIRALNLGPLLTISVDQIFR
jgi:predicted Zn-dependent peptidase